METMIVAKVIINMCSETYNEQKEKLNMLGFEPYNVTNGARKVNGKIVHGKWQRWRKVLEVCEI